ncbi:MAG: CoA-binding protein [Deltaproteobacteria bacterium]|nr:CoA-binding protein [Deltaproteobacteria bacterium]
MNIGQCEMPEYNPPSEEILEILRKVKKIAIVGLSPKENRDSNKVARYLMKQGYEIIPVNPGQRQILGQTCYKSLSDIPFDVDMADLFLNPNKGIPIIWMQLGVVHNEAARKAMEAGIQVIMNKCVKMEHQAMVCSSSR